MANTSADMDGDMTYFTMLKYTYSSLLLICCVVFLMVLISQENTYLSKEVHPALAYVCLWLAVFWLSMIEGSQASLGGLPPVDRDLYKDSHPLTYRTASLCHKGDNLNRYLMGRQFLVLLVVFVVNMSGSPIGPADVFGWTVGFQNAFLGSGFAMILITTNIGQLFSQVNASHCMIDYINTYFGVFTAYVAMAVEFSGILHASYLVQMSVAMLAGKPVYSKEDPRTLPQMLFFWFRCLISTAFLGFSFAVTVKAILDGKTTMWGKGKFPEWATLVLFFAVLMTVGILEAMQIAFFAVAKLPREEQGKDMISKLTSKLLFRRDGKNLPGFMVGRQLATVICFFVLARISTLNVVDTNKNVFGVPDLIQSFLNTGLHVAVIITISGSISWQYLASAFPFVFVSNPLTYILLQFCMFIDFTGICTVARVIAVIQRKINKYQYDEVYVGTPEERLSGGMAPEESIHIEVGHLGGASFPSGTHKPGAHDVTLGEYDTIHLQVVPKI